MRASSSQEVNAKEEADEAADEGASRAKSRIKKMWARARTCADAEISARIVVERLKLHVVPLIDVAMKDLGNRLRDRLPDLRECEQYDLFLKQTFGVNAATS